MKLPKQLSVFLLGMGIIALAFPLTVDAAKPDKYSNFRKKSQLLANTENSALVTSSDQRVRVDHRKLTKLKVTTDDQAFIQELADFSNDVLDASKTPQGIDTATDKLNKYPRVKAYFSQASAFADSGQSLTMNQKTNSSPSTNFAIVGNPISEAAGMADCGAFWNPKPRTAKSWTTHGTGNAGNTLRSWGYHSTSGVVGGGWTRSQTWHPWNCGWNTFRDHALIINNTTIREQNYNGWSPRGEPNPELYASGPWPYGAWPAYVYWWHNTH